jgi:hypothetical protein
MELDALIRSVALRDRHYMFFLGAGASVSSGIPTARDCIWNWKRSLFLTRNSHLDPRLVGDASLPHVQRRIQRWLDQQGCHPPIWGDGEYSHYAERCYPCIETDKPIPILQGSDELRGKLLANQLLIVIKKMRAHAVSPAGGRHVGPTGGSGKSQRTTASAASAWTKWLFHQTMQERNLNLLMLTVSYPSGT